MFTAAFETLLNPPLGGIPPVMRGGTQDSGDFLRGYVPQGPGEAPNGIEGRKLYCGRYLGAARRKSRAAGWATRMSRLRRAPQGCACKVVNEHEVGTAGRI